MSKSESYPTESCCSKNGRCCTSSGAVLFLCVVVVCCWLLAPLLLVASFSSSKKPTVPGRLSTYIVMIGALSRTRPLLKPKREIGLAMSKWWKKKKPTNAEVSGLSQQPQHERCQPHVSVRSCCCNRRHALLLTIHLKSLSSFNENRSLCISQ